MTRSRLTPVRQLFFRQLFLTLTLVALVVGRPLPARADKALSALAHRQIGSGYNKLGRYEDAIREYREAARLSPRYPDAYFGWGMALLHERRYPEAAARITQAIRLDPAHSANAYYSLGRALQAVHQYPQAVTAYLAAIQEAPRLHLRADLFCAACYDCGTCYTELGNYPLAVPQFRHALQIHPDSSNAHWYLARCLSAAGRPDDALAEYLAVLKLDPHDAWAHDCVAGVYCGQRRYADAVREDRMAVTLLPGNAAIHSHLGSVLYLGGDRQGGRQEWQTAAALPASDPAVTRTAQDYLRRYP